MPSQVATRPPFYQSLYARVLLGIAVGVGLGCLTPAFAVSLKPLGDGFIALVRMLIAPVIFTTVVAGVAGMGDLRRVGRVGLKALVYFEGMTTLALALGLLVVNGLQPGRGIHATVGSLDAGAIAGYAASGHRLGAVEFLAHLIPDTLVGAFARGDILQVLGVSVLFGVALAGLGEGGLGLQRGIERLSQVLFRMVALVMELAPVGALGAMAFTVGKFGVQTLLPLAKLMAGVYVTCGLFVGVVLGGVLACLGLGIGRFLRYLGEEVLLVLGTSSSESALPRLIAKLEHLGCAKSVVGLVVPTGYSFNLDGTSIYLTMAAIFIAQAMDIPLTLAQQVGILGLLMLTSKGAAAVTGGGFITLAATLSSIGSIPVAGLALILGVDRFLSEARAVTNLIGNGVACLVVARWENGLDTDRARRVLAGEAVPMRDAASDRAKLTGS